MLKHTLQIVLIHTIASRQLVVMASDDAAKRGVRDGMTLAEARALCPGLTHAPYRPDNDLRCLRALARWMMRFTPLTGIVPPVTLIRERGMGGSPMSSPTPHAPRLTSPLIPPLPAAFLDITGCGRVFGGLANLVEQVIESMRRLRLRSRVAVGPTIGAAWALAAFGRHNGIIIPESQVREAVSLLPPEALRLDPPIVEALHHLGIETIGQLMQLPRSTLPARFGSELLQRIDQVLGRIPEPLVPLEHHTPIEARMDFDGVIGEIETIWLAFKKLIGQIIADLQRRGLGARKLLIELFRSYGQPIVKTIALSRPSRDPVNLFNLMRCAIEGEGVERVPRNARRACFSTPQSNNARAQKNSSPNGVLKHTLRQTLDFTVSNEARGFVGIRISVPIYEPIADEQIPLLEQEEHDGQVELDHLIERLMVRLGEDSIARSELVESHIPERAYSWHGHPAHESPAWHGRLAHVERLHAGSPCHAYRPLLLLSTPAEIRVMVSPSDDRDGRPISITQSDRVRRIIHAIGPERIAGQWWESHNKTRDYFIVEDESGRRSWVFRVRETGRWFLHGEFE